MKPVASLFACICTLVALLSPAARAACPEAEDLDIQLRDKEVQRQLILSGFLAAEIGRSNEKLLRVAISDFRTANNLPGGDQAILTEAECDTLKHNNNAVYAFIGFKQVINPVNQLKMTFPAGLLPPEAKPSDLSWQEYENPAVSRVGIDVFRVSGRESSTNSFSRGYQSYNALQLAYIHNSGSELIAEGAGSRWGSRYYFHNMTFEYQGGQRGIYLRIDTKPPENFVPPPEILPAARLEKIKKQIGKLYTGGIAGAPPPGETEVAWALIARAVFNIVASDFYYQNGWRELTTKYCVFGSGKRARRGGVRIVFATTRAIANKDGDMTTATGLSYSTAPNQVIHADNNNIFLPGHTFVTGDAVVYHRLSGAAIGGLVDGTTYYVIVVDTNTIRLADSYWHAKGRAFDGRGTTTTADDIDAIAVTPIGLTPSTATADQGGIHSLARVLTNLEDSRTYYVVGYSTSGGNATFGLAATRSGTAIQLDYRDILAVFDHTGHFVRNDTFTTREGTHRVGTLGHEFGIVRRHFVVVLALQQQHRRFVAIDEIDRLRVVAAAFVVAEDARFVVDERQESVCAGEADHAGELARREADAGKVARVRREQRGDLAAGRVAHDENARRVAAEFARMFARPGDGARGVVHECRKAHVGKLAVVRDHCDDAVAGQRVADVAEPAPFAALPAAAVEEHDDRRRRAVLRRVDIERQAMVGVVDQAGVRRDAAGRAERADRGIEEVRAAAEQQRENRRGRSARRTVAQR